MEGYFTGSSTTSSVSQRPERPEHQSRRRGETRGAEVMLLEVREDWTSVGGADQRGRNSEHHSKKAIGRTKKRDREAHM